MSFAVSMATFPSGTARIAILYGLGNRLVLEGRGPFPGYTEPLMEPVSLRSVLRRRPDVRFRVIDGEAVVVRQSAAEVLVLNEVVAW